MEGTESDRFIVVPILNENTRKNTKNGKILPKLGCFVVNMSDRQQIKGKYQGKNVKQVKFVLVFKFTNNDQCTSRLTFRFILTKTKKN